MRPEPFLGIDRHFETFNFADSCISVGACAWILAGFRREARAEPETTDTTGEIVEVPKTQVR